MNFLVFLLTNALNLAVIVLLPNDLLASFLEGYSAGNLIFSLLLTLFLSSGFFSDKARSLGLAIVAPLVFLPFIFDVKDWWVGLTYPLALLVLDYVISQSGGATKKQSYLRLLGLSSALILLVATSLIDGLLYRAIILVFIAFVLLSRSCGLQALKIQSGFLYLATIYASYSGVLFVIARLDLTPDNLKIWYISVQIALVLQLKVIDYKTRSSGAINSTIEGVLMLSSALILMGVFLYTPSIWALSAAILGYLGLQFARTKLLKVY